MKQRSSPVAKVWNRSLFVAAAVYMLSSLIIFSLYYQNITQKVLFYSWLLVFINASIGAFIANRALRHGPSGFFVWAVLLNGLRIVTFMIIILAVLKLKVLYAREFIAMTVMGYIMLLAGEIYSLHSQSLRTFKREMAAKR